MKNHKNVGVNLPLDLDKWCEEEGIKKFGRKQSKGDFIRSVLMEKRNQQKNGKT